MSDDPVKNLKEVNRHDDNQVPKEDSDQIHSNSNPDLKRKKRNIHSGLKGKHSDSEAKRRKKENSKQTSTNCRASVATSPSCSAENCYESSKSNSDDLIQCLQEELTCNICSELFINPVTLNCSHSFCEFCISKWRKEHSTCPICRKEITNTNPSLILDRFIEKILATLPEETRNHRGTLIEVREILREHEDTPAPDPTDDTERFVNDFLCWFGISEFMEIFDIRNLDDDPDATNHDHNDNCTIN